MTPENLGVEMIPLSVALGNHACGEPFHAYVHEIEPRGYFRDSDEDEQEWVTIPMVRVTVICTHCNMMLAGNTMRDQPLAGYIAEANYLVPALNLAWHGQHAL